MFQMQQGSAADVAMLAMLEISNNKELKDLGWKLLLQVYIYIKNFACLKSLNSYILAKFFAYDDNVGSR